MDGTNIRVSERVKRALISQKKYPRETYNDVLVRVLNIKIKTDKGDAIKPIRRARAVVRHRKPVGKKIIRGNSLSSRQIKKEEDRIRRELRRLQRG